MQKHQFISVLMALLMIGYASLAKAHLEGVTDTHIELGKNKIKVVYTLPKNDLRAMLSHSRITDGIKIFNAQKNCSGVITGGKSLNEIDSQQFHIDYTCPDDLSTLQISYTLLFDQLPDHKNHVRLSIAGHLQDVTFTKNNTTHAIPVKNLLRQWNTRLNDNNLSVSKDMPFSEKLAAARPYFTIGVKHILLGWDHVVFILCLLSLPIKLQQLFALATTFTVAHSLTLVLSVFSIITLPALIVEALIAASIIYIAIHNIFLLHKHKNLDGFHLPLKSQILTVFSFGLIHGLGFSYILKEIGLGEQIGTALLLFNLGVELGQLIIIAIAFPAFTWVLTRRNGTELSIGMSCAIGAMGVIWFTQRVALI